MRTTKHGVEFIASFEGFADHPYRRKGDVWTIGYGHTGPGVASMGAITHARGLQLLAGDVRIAENAVNALHLELSQNQFDALVSFVFNCGAGTLDRHALFGRALRSPGMRDVPDAMARYVHDGLGRVLPGLVRRRAAEAAMFRQNSANVAAAWLTPKELRRCHELDKLRKLSSRTPEQERRIAVLVSRLTAQRKLIWQRAQPKPEGDGRGWDHRNRRQRYRSLLFRTA
jgi:lysozyme